MKGLYFRSHGTLDVIEYGDVPEPSVPPDHVLLRVKASACNYNDIWARRGLERVEIPLPHISGSDTVGVVEQVGEAVEGVGVGDEVLVHPIFTCRTCAACTSGDEFFCRKAKIWGFETGPYAGGYAELCAVPAASLLPKPPNLSWEEAATLPTIAITAWRMLVRRARVKRDDFVLVWGAAGGTGSMAVQIARHLGARVIGVASNEQRLEYVHELGAEFTIDRSRQDVAVEVARITNRRGVDLVVEHSGRDTWPRSVRSIRRGGALVVCGATSGYMAETDLRFLWNKQLTFYGSHGGSKADLYEVLARVKSGALSPARYDLLALKDGREAQRRLEQGAVVGKIVVAP